MQTSKIAVIACLAAVPPLTAQYVISTVAGGVLPDNVAASSVSFQPKALALDSAGNLYAADQYTVYRITPDGNLTVFAGNGLPGLQGDGKQATSASFTSIAALAADAGGNIYIADPNNNRVRKVDAATGVITTVVGGGTSFADGARATDAQLSGPSGLAFDKAGNLYIAEVYGQRVRRVDGRTLAIATVAGTGIAGSSGDGGPATEANLNGPQRLAVDPEGNLFVAEAYGFRVRKVLGNSGTINTVAGTGSAGYGGDGLSPLEASLSGSINGLAVDSGGALYISDGGNHRIRKVAADLSSIQTLAGGTTPGFQGDGGPASKALLNNPAGIALSSGNVLFLADTANSRVRAIDLNSGIITTPIGGGAAGDGGPATRAQFNRPSRLAVDANGDLYLNDCGSGRIRRLSVGSGTISTIAGTGYPGYGGDYGPAIYAQIQGCGGITFDNHGFLYLADTENYRVRRIDPSTGTIQTYAGIGPPGSSRTDVPANNALLRPDWLSADAQRNLYITDSRNNLVREIVARTGILHDIAGTGTAGFSGDGGSAQQAHLAAPGGVAVDASGNVYFTDTANQRIRRIAAGTGAITTVAGTGAYGHGGDGGPAIGAAIGNPTGIAIDASGNLYFVESAFGYVRRIDTGGTITTIAGGGQGGTSLFLPSDVAVDSAGNIYVSEPELNRVRKLSVPGPSVPQILTSALPAAILGIPYEQTLAAFGGAPPFRTWALTSGALPPGIALDAGSGILKGTPVEVGTYSFTVQATDDAGSEVEKTLTLETRPPGLLISADGIRNGASLRSGAIAPGEVLQISAALGLLAPDQNSAGASGFIDTILDGARMYFDGVAAPVLAAGPGQITVVAPFSLSGKTTTMAQVEYNGNPSNLVTLAVQAANPAFFTQNLSGSGQASATNEDGTPNSPSNPAAPGSIVVLWATGAGQTDPPGVDGQLGIEPLAHTVLPVSVSVAGRDATVLYAGAAASEIAGVLQIRLRLPSGLTPGDALPLMLRVGNYSSGEETTIAVQ